jgi:hypothetical protein
LFGFNSCSKDKDEAQTTLSYRMLNDKTWFLDYVETINGTSVKTRSYLGQTTYFINFLKDKTTLDSDGISGTYSIDVVDGNIIIKVNAKTFGGNVVIYDYEVYSLGDKVLVMSNYSNGIVNKNYYSSK